MSVFDAPIRESGAVAARHGYAYQDHVAVWLVTHMLSDETISELWCDCDDDITLIRHVEGRATVEFVQVKTSQPHNLWSVARLVAQAASSSDAEGSGTSLLHKSLYRDQYQEPCSFRVVTEAQVQQHLELLKLEPAKRDPVQRQDLIRKLNEKLGPLHSANGHGIPYWVDNVQWTVLGSAAAIKGLSFEAFVRYIGEHGLAVRGTDLETLYDALLGVVQRSAQANTKQDKRVLRHHIFNLIDSIIGSPIPATCPHCGNTEMLENVQTIVESETTRGNEDVSRTDLARVLRFRPQYPELLLLREPGFQEEILRVAFFFAIVIDLPLLYFHGVAAFPLALVVMLALVALCLLAVSWIQRSKWYISIMEKDLRAREYHHSLAYCRRCRRVIPPGVSGETIPVEVLLEHVRHHARGVAAL